MSETNPEKFNKKKATLKKAGMLDTIYDYKEKEISLKELANNYMSYIFMGQPYPHNNAPEVMEELRMLSSQMDNLDIALDKEKGSILHLPYAGAIEEQPAIRFGYFLVLRQ
jgi:hypothetical protein